MGDDAPLEPPYDIAICFGGGDFKKAGQWIKSLCVSRLGLAPSGRVLDVGCGAGRAAIPLTDYLTTGRYEGFDVFPIGVEWASANITPRFPNFVFRSVSVYNKTYNPFSPVKARDFRFPYPDASFDAAILNSVFTHMFPEDVHGYMRELSRTLDAGGGTLITWYLVDGLAREMLAKKEAKPDMSHKFGSFYVENPAEPEDAVAYDQGFVERLYAQAGFDILEILPGSWKKAPGASNHQDAVLAVKRREGAGA